MVGVPRSTGCAVCLGRHLKCDETRPHCLRCQKSGRPCPGYAKRFVFKQSSLASSKKRSEQSPSSSSTDSESITSLVPCSKGAGSATYLILPPSERDFLSIAAIPTPFVQQSQLIGSFISAFSPTGIVPGQTLYTRSWLSQVYDRIGKDVSLDISMRSLSCLYYGIGTSDTRLVNAGRSLYVDALRSLRDDLTNPRVSRAAIQSTTMLLTFYELIANKTENSWIRHSGGASQIMRIRGPEAYRSGFDYSMYLVCRGYIIIEAFMSERPCFLEEPAWEALTRIPKQPMIALQERLFVCHAKVPRLLRDAQRANRGLHDTSDVISRASEMRLTMKAHFFEWWNSLDDSSSRPIEKPSGDEMFPIALHFPNIILPGLLCSHYSCLIILNQLLIDSCAVDSIALIEESHAAAVEICKCSFQSQTRLLGSIYMPFWLRVAADGCAPEHYAWIMSKWNQFRTPGNGRTSIEEWKLA